MRLDCKQIVLLVLMCSFTLGASALRADEKVAVSTAPTWFAKIDGESIGVDEFAANMRSAAKNKFYHGAPPQAALDALKKEVSDRLIAQYLVIREARKLGKLSDKEAVAKVVAEFENKNKANTNWQSQRAEVLPLLIKRAEEDDVYRQLERDVRKVSISEANLKQFYENNHALFTTPAKNHVKMIMLKVDPSAGVKDRERAVQRIKTIEAQLKAGESFERLARRHSSDESAARGGDLGLLHQGQLSEQAEAALAKLTPGEFSPALQLLDGWAVIKLVQREAAVLNPLDRVKERASALYEREQSEQQWKLFVEQLRQKAVIEVNPDL